MKIFSLTYEQLLIAKQAVGDIAELGFAINVSRSFREGKITVEQKNNLLAIKSEE